MKLRLVLIGLLSALFILFFFVLAGYDTMGLVCLGYIALLIFYPAVKRLKNKKLAGMVVRVVSVILCVGLLLFCVTEFFIIRASFGDADEPAEYLLVLGAKVNANGSSYSLRNRIDAAYDYLTAHPDTIAILSGGQGANEPMTEAQCMYDELTEMGIDGERLWMEGASTSTWENLKFTLALIEEKTGSRPAHIAMVSSEYHLFRAGLFAKEFGLETTGVPAATTLPVLKLNYFFREAVAIWYFIIFGGQ